MLTKASKEASKSGRNSLAIQHPPMLLLSCFGLPLSVRVIISPADAIELVDVWLCNDVSGAVEKD